MNLDIEPTITDIEEFGKLVRSHLLWARIQFDDEVSPCDPIRAAHALGRLHIQIIDHCDPESLPTVETFRLIEDTLDYLAERTAFHQQQSLLGGEA